MPTFFSNHTLRSLDTSGWIAGPKETDWSLQLRIGQKDRQFQPPSSPLQYRAAKRVWTLFGTDPQGHPWQFDKGNLRLWQLGCFEMDQSDRGSSIQIAQGGKRWGYSQEELLAHELAHAARAAFSADLFDEYLCYRTSERCYRRILGPYFSCSFALPLICTTTLSGLMLNLLSICNIDAFYELISWKIWIFTLGIQFLLFLGYLVLYMLFALATARLRHSFGTRSGWWLFRLTLKEALQVAIWGIAPLKKIGKFDHLLPRNRLFAGELCGDDQIKYANG